jgi:hypothetical protein
MMRIVGESGVRSSSRVFIISIFFSRGNPKDDIENEKGKLRLGEMDY